MTETLRSELRHADGKIAQLEGRLEMSSLSDP
jgi:hypothetical protein